MEWIDVNEKLPPLNVTVYVRGMYTPEDVPFPKARLTNDWTRRSEFAWESNEWRGIVGITHWCSLDGEELTGCLQVNVRGKETQATSV